MPNQTQQWAVPPCGIDWGRGRSKEMRGEDVALAVIRCYLAVTALISFNSWGLPQLRLSRCVHPLVNYTHSRSLTLTSEHSLLNVHACWLCALWCPISARPCTAPSLRPQAGHTQSQNKLPGVLVIQYFPAKSMCRLKRKTGGSSAHKHTYIWH